MKNEGIQLWAVDEVRFQRHSTITRMWSLKGKQPRVISASTRQKLGFLTAINSKTGQLLTKKAFTFNADTFDDFLYYLLQHTKEKLFLILDHASWHRAQDLKKFFFENQHRLLGIFLPPYSSELNPIERVWRITRRQITHNRHFESIQDLEAALIPYFSEWEQPNNALMVLCANI